MSNLVSPHFGDVNFYNKKKGLGVIVGNDGRLFFFHKLEAQDRDFQEGDQVTFLVKEGQVRGKLTAYNVKIV